MIGNMFCKVFGHKVREYEPLALPMSKDLEHNIRIRDHFQRYCKRCGINMPFIEDYRKVDMEKLSKNKDFEDWQALR